MTVESKNKFWKGALVGALLTALAGLVIVGMSLGIFLIGKAAIDGNGQTGKFRLKSDYFQDTDDSGSNRQILSI